MSDYVHGVKIFKNDYDENNGFRPFRMVHKKTSYQDEWQVLNQDGEQIVVNLDKRMAAPMRNILNDQVEPLLRRIAKLESEGE